jgi:hypothetical protein
MKKCEFCQVETDAQLIDVHICDKCLKVLLRLLENWLLQPKSLSALLEAFLPKF